MQSRQPTEIAAYNVEKSSVIISDHRDWFIQKPYTCKMGAEDKNQLSKAITARAKVHLQIS
jgi:hypothetical protein